MKQDPVNAFKHFAQEWRPTIEEALDRRASFPPTKSKTLTKAMRYSLLLPGKRVRPLLVLLGADICGAKPEKAMPAAVAIEMVHAFSLIHDDLPAMDDDDLRRGKPTNHTVFGEAQAILAGDGLLTEAFHVLTSEITSPEIALRCCRELACATGPSGMTGGQSLDMEGLSKDATLEDLESLHMLKTGALIICSLRLGAIIAGASASKIQALTQYGRHLGLAFQITDDLLDMTGSEKKTGKKIGKDRGKGKKTFPAFLGVEGSRKAAAVLIDAAKKTMKPFGRKSEKLMGLAMCILDRET